MKTIIAIGISVGLSLAALADSPTFNQITSRSGTTNVNGYFATDAQRQIRIVGCIGTSDKAASVFSFRTGTTPQTISATNAAGTGITVSSTNGLATGDILIIEGAAGITNATISAFPASTNITLNISTGMQTIPGDQVYKASAATTIKCAATTAVYQGEAIYVATVKGRPVWIIIDGTSACSLDSITARYE